MKIRNGFVSNSSSSSFVIIGVPMTDELKNKVCTVNCMANDDFDFYDIDDVVSTSDGAFLGRKLKQSDECGIFDDKSFSIQQLIAITSELSEKYNVPKDNFSLMIFTRSC